MNQPTTATRKETSMTAVSRSMQISYKVNGELLKLDFPTVKDIICRNQKAVTDQEVIAFMHFCKAMQANPFIGDAYLIRYDESQPAAFVVGIGYHEARADTYPEYQGMESGIIIKRLDGVIEDRIGCFLTEDETLMGGWARAFRSDRKIPTVVRVNLDRYQKMRWKDNKRVPMALWGTNAPDMICKVAKSQALRQTFKQLRGSFLEAELDMSKDVDHTEAISVTIEDLQRELHNLLKEAGLEHTSEQMEIYMRGVAGNMQLQEQDLYLRMLNEWEKGGQAFQDNFITKMKAFMGREKKVQPPPKATAPPTNGKTEPKVEVKADTPKAKEDAPKGQVEILARMRKEILKAVSHLGSKDEINAALTAAADGEMDMGLLERTDDQAMLHDILEKLKVKK